MGSEESTGRLEQAAEITRNNAGACNGYMYVRVESVESTYAAQRCNVEMTRASHSLLHLACAFHHHTITPAQGAAGARALHTSTNPRMYWTKRRHTSLVPLHLSS